MLPTHELHRQEARWSIDGVLAVDGALHEDFSDAVSAGSSLHLFQQPVLQNLEQGVSQTIAWMLTDLQSSSTDLSRA